MDIRSLAYFGTRLPGLAALMLSIGVWSFGEANALAATDGPGPDSPFNAQITAGATDRLADHFVTFTGSEDNATALVTGLHNGTAIDLSTTVNGQTTTTTITPAAGAMTYGDVLQSLALAEAELTKLGITQPTTDQIQAALDGGSVTTGLGTTAVTTPLTGVLVLKNQGNSWTQVAQSMGVDLGTAVMTARTQKDPQETSEHGPGMAGKTARTGDRFANRIGGMAEFSTPSGSVPSGSTPADTAAVASNAASAHGDSVVSCRVSSMAAAQPAMHPSGAPLSPRSVL